MTEGYIEEFETVSLPLGSSYKSRGVDGAPVMMLGERRPCAVPGWVQTATVWSLL